VSFKRDVYRKVMKEFANFALPLTYERHPERRKRRA
jgi:putative (di)nucleoside polyphosphate hydrolase